MLNKKHEERFDCNKYGSDEPYVINRTSDARDTGLNVYCDITINAHYLDNIDLNFNLPKSQFLYYLEVLKFKISSPTCMRHKIIMNKAIFKLNPKYY